MAGEDWGSLVLTLDPDPNRPAVGDTFWGGELGTLSILATSDVFLNRTLAWENEVTVGYDGDRTGNAGSLCSPEGWVGCSKQVDANPCAALRRIR